MATDLGLENLLGTADDDGSPGLRDRLALSTRYLANWYKATSSSDNKAIWWQKIDTVRRKVTDTYNELLEPLNLGFLSQQAKADYNDASASWADLWRQLMLSTDTIDVSLISQAADLVSTVVTAPLLLAPQISNAIGKAIGGSLGGFFAQTWPWLAGAGGLVALYYFGPALGLLAKKAAAR